MTDNHLTLFCLVDGEATSNAFPAEIESITTIGDLKKLIKAEQSPDFDDNVANKLTLWRVFIPEVKQSSTITVDALDDKTELDKPRTPLSELFREIPEDNTYVIVQRPPLGHLHADIKNTTDKFFAPGPIANFLDAFVKGEGALPITSGAIHGLPRAWRRGFGKAPETETRPSLLFMDLLDPSTPDSESRNLSAGSILDMVKEYNRYHILQCSASLTRAVIKLLSQHWGFYFSAADDDWGSDMMTLYGSVRDHLKDLQASYTVVDLKANNAYARKITLLLFLSWLLVFKHCLSVLGDSETFASARWALLQVCPHVLFRDIFNALFLKLLDLQHHGLNPLSLLIRNVYEDAKGLLVERGCLPKIKDDTRLLVINDEAQFLGDQFNGSFQSKSSSEDSLRPLLSLILHAFRDIGQHQLTLVTCGTGLSINTLFWVQSSGSGLKDSSTNLECFEFPGWIGLESIKAYVSRVRRCLLNDESRRVLGESLPQDALDMLFDKFVDRYRPAIVPEKIVEHSEHGSWKAPIEGTEDKLVAWEHRTIKGNLCRELDHLDQKHKDARHDKSAVENYFTATDPGFQTALKELMDRTDAAAQGNIFGRYMMTVFSETFKSRRLSD
ncbi:hypothetical protein KI688_007935 [Linnemannia hyalina]|uniref:Crinkler effector protein N-terminal domain-containing protein n=1 Tax=Linnemannia hyalina TaxID=64524 RepID=A0A9P8BML4_9FUNG|nr:hypothetical protein KI688_007935 [Linnemannia hyalina]